MTWLTDRYRHTATWAIEHRYVTVGVAIFALLLTMSSRLVRAASSGRNFLPHLDEGAIWVRGTLAPSTGPTAGVDLMNRARVVLAAFPEATNVISQVGRPDDGTDATGFFNTEYFVDLKPKDKWRPVFHENKDELIGAMNRELQKMPGVVWSFSQPISGQRRGSSQWCERANWRSSYTATTSKVLEQKSDQILAIMGKIKGVEDLGVYSASLASQI